LNDFLAPMRARRAEYEQAPDLVRDIIHQGTNKMKSEAKQTMALVHDAMGMYRL
jgi:tryptophanyl-tRNA synthetase